VTAPQFGQPGADRAGRPAAQVKRRIKRVEDGSFGIAEAVCAGHRQGDNPQVGGDPRRQLRVIFGSEAKHARDRFYDVWDNP
jgi:hypothetical protein